MRIVGRGAQSDVDGASEVDRERDAAAAGCITSLACVGLAHSVQRITTKL